MVIERINRAFNLTQDLLEALDESSLSYKLTNLPSNRIGDQFWCIVGARESYIKSMIAGQWVGFSCSLDDPLNKEKIFKCLAASHQQLEDVFIHDTLTPNQVDLAYDLLEHEVMHHGQLMRYMYGHKIKFPLSWVERYHV